VFGNGRRARGAEALAIQPWGNYDFFAPVVVVFLAFAVVA
jgi:hypothetical protein